ncbi:hypothetical protein C8Q78DRAFT_966790 [Trametes maxima]|nr:hypothetical protein C8Q78DRAFT_966790 [Trametes maxima]
MYSEVYDRESGAHTEPTQAVVPSIHRRPSSELSYADTRHDGPRRCRIEVIPSRDSRSPSSEADGDDRESYVYPQAQRIVEPIQGKHPRQNDFETDAQEVLKLAYVYFKAELMSKDAYPDKLTEKTWAIQAWRKAADKLGIELSHSSELIAIIRQYTWNLRGELKIAACNTMRSCYDFKGVAAPAARQHNIDRARFLLASRNFAYKVLGPLDEGGLYEAEAIQEVIDQVFYKSPEDDGVVLDTIYTPFPKRGLALVLTAIQCAIEEWTSGTLVNVNFSESAFSPSYKLHLQNLDDFERESGDDHFLTEICTQISKNGKSKAKAPDVRHQDESALTENDISRAVQAYRRRKRQQAQAGAFE